MNPNSTYTYRVRAFNADGNSGYSNEASAMTQTPPNQPPTATITQPADGSTHPVGQPIDYAGDATDPEDGVLPASAFTWKVILPQGNTIVLATGVKSGSATPTIPGNYTLILEVTDSGGLTGTDQVNLTVQPAKANSEGEATHAQLAFRLLPAYPNPFNPSTRIRFQMDKPGPVTLAVYNLAGKRVRLLLILHG
ncbi:MAG: hypothetical protein Q9P14_14670 [candidate division KSB1 bacterium]|nr:hypothetical protein [candidate division KSB1 bacterium]